MKALILVFLLVFSDTAFLFKENKVQFENFMVDNNKFYLNEAEETKRFSIFGENLRSIKEHNSLYAQGHTTWKQRVNKFADMTRKEFSVMLGALLGPSMNGTRYVKSKLAVPFSIDWRTLGHVTEVKMQGEDCGSCWSFSLAGSTEAAYYRKYRKLVSLSEQQLLDCSTTDGDGCVSGYVGDTFPYIQQNGLEAESNYPYEAKVGLCRYESSKVVAKISSFTVLTPGDEEELLNAIGTVGPVSATMDGTFLSTYDSGIYNVYECSILVNHAVLIVGYGSEDGQDYWIIKNSWGNDWGENGYFRMLRGENMCGIAQSTVYPTIN